MWNEHDNCLTQEFTFQGFAQALAFVNAVGDLAEQHNHHPDILLYEYKRVRITLQTHSAKVVTEKDRDLAKLIDQLQ